jgi:hypothetical protein
MEYLRWLQQQSQMFLRPAYTEDDIAQLPDSDGDNEIVDEYDEMTRNDIVQPECGPFQNYVVSIFYIHCIRVENCDTKRIGYHHTKKNLLVSFHQSTRRTCTGPAYAKLIIILITPKQ